MNVSINGASHWNEESETEDEATPPSSEKERRQGMSPSDVLARWRAHGPVRRLSTGWQTYDEASRGGFLLGRLTFIIGAPNAKKTGMLGCLAMRWARERIAVGALLVDEEPEDFLARLAEQCGFTLDDCEQRKPKVVDRIEEALRDLPIRFYDLTWTLEEAEADFAAFVQVGGFDRAAFMADTAQTIASAAADKAESVRTALSAIVKALHTMIVRRRWCGVVTSEMPRAGYRSETSKKEFDDMGAGKESGAIEYAAKTQLVLRSVKDHGDVVHVNAPKVKLGREVEFHLRFDCVSHTLTECAAPEQAHDEADRDEQQRAKNARKVDADAKALADIILRNQGMGELELRGALRRAGHSWGRERLAAAKQALGGRLVNRGPHARDVRWHLVSDADGGNDGDG